MHSTGNRKAIEASEYAGCYSCCCVFDTKKVTDWRDEWQDPIDFNRRPRWSALCPDCGEATVIPSSTGLLEDQGYLPIIDAIVREQNAPNR